jgi:hypothetical protein
LRSTQGTTWLLLRLHFMSCCSAAAWIIQGEACRPLCSRPRAGRSGNLKVERLTQRLERLLEMSSGLALEP